MQRKLYGDKRSSLLCLSVMKFFYYIHSRCHNKPGLMLFKQFAIN